MLGCCLRHCALRVIAKLAEQHGMDNNLAECRTAELINDQTHALPHRLNSRAPLHAKPYSARFVCCWQRLERGRGNHHSHRFFPVDVSTPDSSELFPL